MVLERICFASHDGLSESNRPVVADWVVCVFTKREEATASDKTASPSLILVGIRTKNVQGLDEEVVCQGLRQDQGSSRANPVTCGRKRRSGSGEVNSASRRLTYASSQWR